MMMVVVVVVVVVMMMASSSFARISWLGGGCGLWSQMRAAQILPHVHVF